MNFTTKTNPSTTKRRTGGRASLLALVTLLALTLAGCAATSSNAKRETPDKEDEHREPKVAGSIHPPKGATQAQLEGLAKITYEEALRIASAKVKGRLKDKGELEAENDCLMYSFEFIDDRQAVIEVEIDAGNGAVLSVDRG